MPPPRRIPISGLLGIRVPTATSPALGIRLLSHSARRPGLLQRSPASALQRPAATPIARRHLSDNAQDRVEIKVTEPEPGILRVQSRKGQKPWNLSTLWLRDTCTCPLCVDPDSGQKNFATTEISSRPPYSRAEVAEDGSLVIEWENDFMSGGPHTSRWTPEEVNSWFRSPSPRISWHVPRTLWNKAKYESLRDQCQISYDDWLHNDDAFAAVFEKLFETGLVFVKDVPTTETEVEKVANRIGILQQTFYGATWDVRSKPHAENVAYTSKFLGLHQDLMYHKPIPKLQFLHCLENSCEGGESLFSDGLRAAYDLKLNQPAIYAQLCDLPVHFHYKKGGHDYEWRHSTIREVQGWVQSTHWAPPFQAPFSPQHNLRGVQTPLPAGSVLQWHRAAKAFQENIEAPENVVEVKLRPGECVIFDNTRLLHGRRQFTASQGHRWLKGTYISPQVFRGAENRLAEKMKPHALKHVRANCWKAEMAQLRELAGGETAEQQAASGGQ